MKIGIFWNNLQKEEADLLRGIIDDMLPRLLKDFSGFKSVFLFNRSKSGTVEAMGFDEHFELLSYEDAENVGDVLQALRLSFEYALKNNIDFGIFSNSGGWVLDSHKLRMLLEKEELASNAFSLRAGSANGIAQKFSPRLPFIDDNFFVFNTGKCTELGIFAKNTRFVSHFGEWGKGPLHLLSFLEACVPYGYVYVYSDASNCRNLFGDKKRFFPTPYLYEQVFGFLSSNQPEDDRVHALRCALLKKLGYINNPKIMAYFIKCKGFKYRLNFIDDSPFIKRKTIEALLNFCLSLKLWFARLINFEFVKRYG